MFEISDNSLIIENIISLSKESFFHPFKVEFTIMYQDKKEVHYIKDIRNDLPEYLSPGPILSTLLDIIVEEKITSYPFEEKNFNEGTLIDEIDFFTNSNVTNIETTPNFMRFLRQKNYIKEEKTTEEEESHNWVSAPHLTKLQLTLEKASSLSSFSIQTFSRYPVELLSLVSQRDLVGTNKTEKIKLDNVTMTRNSDTITIVLGKPIYTKRLTFVLGQFNADENNYIIEGVNNE